MNIRSAFILSLLLAGLGAAGCETTEETKPVNTPAVKQPSSSTIRDRSVAPTTPPMSRETQPAPATKEMPSQPMVKDKPLMKSEPSLSAIGVDPLQTCLAGASKGVTEGQRDLAEETCQRDYGKADSRAVASGTQGDTLQGCTARIPKDATAGQRMVAEESCRRDEEVRKGF